MVSFPQLLVRLCMWDVIFEDSSSTVTSSSVDCGRLCYLNTTCSSFLFNQGTGFCHLQNRWMQHLVESETTGIYYYQVYTDACSGNGYQYIRSTSMCVKFSVQEASWRVAKRRCETEGAQLVKLDTEEKDNAILEILQNEYPKTAFYIGGHDPEQSRRFKWVDGSLLEYTNYLDEELDEDDICLIIKAKSSKKGWYMKKCFLVFHYICEKV